MFHPSIERPIRLFAAASYLLALAASGLSHVHVHPLGDTGRAHGCAAVDHGACAQRHERDGAEADEHAEHHPGGLPTSSEDDCNICRFLGRPTLPVTLFELAEISAPVAPLPAMRVPALQPIVLVVTHARAPPIAAQTI